MSAAAVETGAEAVLEVRDLRKYFPVRSGVMSRVGKWLKAVDGVSFDIAAGETFGLVGESGCGKTTVGRSLLRLIEPTSGSVRFEGRELVGCSRGELRAMRPRMQIVFQDPYASLNPRMTVGNIIGEALRVHGIARGKALDLRVSQMLERVGLAAEFRTRYPHEFSGGQRQRIGIARALALEPRFIVCDEAVSALDVSIQAQVLNLLADLQSEYGIAYLFISHDLNVVRHVADRVGVMYLGRLVEVAPAQELFERPQHPYTQALIAANPVPDPRIHTERIPLDGEVPSPLSPPSGCPFHPRCPVAQDRCSVGLPDRVMVGPDHEAHCVLAEALAGD